MASWDYNFGPGWTSSQRAGLDFAQLQHFLTDALYTELPDFDSIIFNSPNDLIIRFDLELSGANEDILGTAINVFDPFVNYIGDDGIIPQTEDNILHITNVTNPANSTAKSALKVDGGLVISKNTFLCDNVDLGETSDDKVKFNAALATHIIPDTTGSYTLGNATKKFDHVYVKGNIYVDGNIDGRDVAIDGNSQDNHIATTSGNPHTVTMGEITPTTTAGDLIYHSSSGVTRLPAGIDKYVLTMDTTNGDKLGWQKNNFFDVQTDSILFDDFHGAEFDSAWSCIIDGAASTITHQDGLGGQIKLTSDTAVGNYAELTTVKNTVEASESYNIQCRLKVDDITNTTVEFGIELEVNNRVLIRYDATTAGNWFTVTKSAGTETAKDTTVVANAINWVILEIRGSTSNVEFWINGVLKTTHTTNLPTDMMRTFVRQSRKTAVVRNTLVDYLCIKTDREAADGASGGSVSGACVLV
jgi:hypothetical protein